VVPCVGAVVALVDLFPLEYLQLTVVLANHSLCLLHVPSYMLYLNYAHTSAFPEDTD
jgi:hypothetical protein